MSKHKNMLKTILIIVTFLQMFEFPPKPLTPYPPRDRRSSGACAFGLDLMDCCFQETPWFGVRFDLVAFSFLSLRPRYLPVFIKLK